MDFELNGQAYKCGKISAVKQFHILRRLAPVLSGLAPLLSSGPANGSNFDEIKTGIMADPDMLEKALTGFAAALAALSDADSELVLFGLLACVTRKQAQGLGWAPIVVGDALMFQDIELGSMLQIAVKAAMYNFGDFLNGLPSALPGEPLRASGL